MTFLQRCQQLVSRLGEVAERQPQPIRREFDPRARFVCGHATCRMEFSSVDALRMHQQVCNGWKLESRPDVTARVGK